MKISLIREAHERIRRTIRETPIETSSSLNSLVGAELFFKCENLQRGGSFKIRGAMNAVLSLSDKEMRGGVCTHSSGNHAQALAIAAAQRQVPATVVMPNNAPLSKQKATADRGAKIVLCGPTLEEREAACARVQQESNAVLIHSSSDPRIIAGQGTIALEMLQAAGDLDAIVVPVGGGGLASGVCIASQAAKVYGVEPEMADDAFRSLQTGERLGPRPPLTVADGLRTALSERTFSILQEGLETIFLVSEEEILAAMRLLWERLKLIVEPSGAVAFAGILRHKEVFAGKRVGIVLSGGNVDLTGETLGQLFR